MQKLKFEYIETKSVRRHYRGFMGRLLAACLLIVWGAYSGVSSLIMADGDLLRTEFSGMGYIIWTFFGQALLCLLAGVSILLGARLIVSWFLNIAILCELILVGKFLIIPPNPNYPKWEILLTYYPVFFLVVAVVLFSLGRWFGRQEDIKA